MRGGIQAQHGFEERLALLVLAQHDRLRLGSCCYELNSFLGKPDTTKDV
jgi:hypothetical protein